MSLTDTTREKEFLTNWAKENKRPEILNDSRDDNLSSYFVASTNEPDIMEYDFQILPELKEKLNEMWKEDEVLLKAALPLSVAAFKSEPAADKFGVKGNGANIDEEFVLPDFVYVF